MDAARTALQSRGKIPPRARSSCTATGSASMTARLYRYRTSPCNNAMPILRKPAALRRGPADSPQSPGRAKAGKGRAGRAACARPAGSSSRIPYSTRTAVVLSIQAD